MTVLVMLEGLSLLYGDIPGSVRSDDGSAYVLACE